MKKYLLVLLSVLLLAGSVCAQDTDKTHTIVERTYKFYDGMIDDVFEEPFPLYFMDGVDDLPYVELESWMELQIKLMREWLSDPNYDLMFNAEGTDAAYVRENEYHLQFDFAKKTIAFDDFNAFVHSSSEGSLLDLLSASGFTEAGESELYQRNLDASYDRYGDEVRIDLASYNIPMIMQDGKYYMPLQTMNDLLISPVIRATILFNGECLMLINRDLLGTVSRGLTELGELYYAAEKTEMSKELAEFGYWELCFVLDNLYGLKEPHEIEYFDQFFWQMGFDEQFKQATAEEADALLYKFIDFYLDDLHSEFIAYSYRVGPKEVEWTTGPATRKLDESVATYGKARAAFYDEGYFDENPEPYIYEEVGNTAYITFDHFTNNAGNVYYDAIANGENLPKDTIGLLIYAYDKIYRQDSPIENIVIDLSNNTGGAVDAAIYLIGWVLGDAPFSVKDTFTGALSTASYRVDVNLDRKFDGRDMVVDDKNVYVLISPISFSCGNLVPAALQASDKVTILGRTSGGGSCIVQPLSTAWGTFFQISGSSRMSFLKNGSFYDIDTGVTPDYTITKPNKFYDHEALTDYINNLY
ncbi:MAG: S41 family peptidase [Flexilinea sp.]|nr:S41 family peptidase [Flexilinea sp.]